jgi:UDP-N-acetylmuramoyl-L-alanyl-D-glutamate--2,6-diaminopimelate ligase
MRANELAALLNGSLSGLSDETHIPLFQICFDSRHVVSGCIFFAISGARGDGHAYVKQAIKAGSVLAVVERLDPENAAQPQILVTNSRSALSKLSSFLAGDLTQKMRCIGITGTNGKTTTNWILFSALNALGTKTYRIGTLGTALGSEPPRQGELTTPDPIAIHQGISEAYRQGARACVMEASSHALHQHRIDDVAFDAAVFTNLTRDHLDYHRTYEEYTQAKFRLFELLASQTKPQKIAVLNIDDPIGAKWQSELAALKLQDFSYGRGAKAAVRLLKFSQNVRRSQLTLQFGSHEHEVFFPFIGEHNAENVAAAFAVLVGFGYSVTDICRALESCPQVPGRLESVGTAEVAVFVDYAHTPDALERALKALRPLVHRKLWVLFGCGGDRDRGKRPQMAKVAETYADNVVVTSDNPRTEDPGAIIKDILAEGVRAILIEEDRRSAIVKTISMAQPGDVILIAGKGHEDYQIIGTQKIHFSDQEIVREVLGT